MIEIRPLTKVDITEGLTGPGAYCLNKLPPKNWSVDPDERSLQKLRWERYLEFIDRFGTFGLIALEDNEIAGFITFVPKTIARRLGFYSLPGDDNLEKTLVVACLHVAQSKRGRGIASRLIQSVKERAKQEGYVSIEAIGEGYPQYGWHASAPFLSCGFKSCRNQQHGSWCGQVMQYGLDSSAE